MGSDTLTVSHSLSHPIYRHINTVRLHFLDSLVNAAVFIGAVTDSDLFRSCSNILDKFGSKPTRDNLAVVNGSNRSPASASFKDFLLGR